MYQTRRKKLMESLPENSAALFFSGIAPYKIGDEKYDFCVDRSFYYLTGLDKENMVLCLVKLPNKNIETLFIEPYDEELAKWIGGRIFPNEAAEYSQINDVRMRDQLDGYIQRIMQYTLDQEKQIQVFGDFTKQEFHQTNAPQFAYFEQLRKNYPYICIQNIASEITQLRLIKDQHEIQLLLEAIDVTRQGIEAMMANAEPEMSENQIEAYFDFELKFNGCQHSFPSIVAAGNNGCVLHYAENNQPVKDGDLVLCDLGASYQYMNADITRTFPVNGKFTERQRQIYDIVLRANKMIIQMARPGLTLRQLEGEVLQYYQVELNALGLLKDGKTVRDYYYHSVSHMLGLETHDVNLSNWVLKPGNVFTVEPGLYLEEEGIGIRIEDNILITEDGCINLSESIMKEADEIEAFMKAARQ